jgi:hypothetical protein
MDPEVARLVEKFGLNKGSCSLNKAGFTRFRNDKKPLRRVAVNAGAAPDDEEQYKKSIDEGIKDFNNEHERFVRAIGDDNYAASKNRFRKGDATQLVFIKEDPEPIKLNIDPKNINLAATLERTRQLNEKRKREEAEANYNINKLECANMDYLTSSSDSATRKVIRERRKAGWDARHETKKELGNTHKETINASKYENNAILERMRKTNPGFSKLQINTGIINDATADKSVEQTVMSNRNISFVKKTVEEDIILNEQDAEEIIDA